MIKPFPCLGPADHLHFIDPCITSDHLTDLDVVSGWQVLAVYLWITIYGWRTTLKASTAPCMHCTCDHC